MYLLFDIGGTKMRLAQSEDGVSLQEVKLYDTPLDFKDALKILSNFAHVKYDLVAGCLPGVFNQERSALLKSPNLPGWVGYSIKKEFQEIFKSEVILENDAALAGLGEAFYGAGKGRKIVAYITLSTGFGGARIVDGKVDVNNFGFEPGNQIVDLDASLFPQSVEFNPDNLAFGSIESYISGAALEFRYKKPSWEIKESEIWSKVEKILAVGINNILVFWSPEVVVLGGGIVLDNAISIENVENELRKTVKIFPSLPELKKAELGDKSAIYGGLVLIKNYFERV